MLTEIEAEIGRDYFWTFGIEKWIYFHSCLSTQLQQWSGGGLRCWVFLFRDGGSITLDSSSG